MSILDFKLKKELLSEGFLPREIRDIDNAKTPDGKRQNFNINSKVFSAFRRSRINYIADLKSVGWTLYEIRQKIVDHYKRDDLDVFGFLKLEYRPGKKIGSLPDAVLRRKSIIRAKVTKRLGYNYGRSSKREGIRRLIPRPAHPIIIRRRIKKER
jgi:hypothetical protein